MNKIDFLKYTNFPLDSHTMDFLQGMIESVAKMSAVCGDKVIVAGGKENGGKVEDGLVVINGELLELKGDVKVDKVYIEEKKEGVVCLNEEYKDLYIRRCVKFGIGNGGENFNWAEFKRLDTLSVMKDKLANLQSVKSNVGHGHSISDITNLSTQIVPRGLIAMWSGSHTAVPTGWTLCNGTTVNGLVTPDLRGRFIVGYSGSGDYSSVGNRGGADKVSLSPEQLPKHRHYFKDYYFAEKHTIFADNEDGSDYLDREVCGSNATDKGNRFLFFMNHYTYEQGEGQAHENRPLYYTLAYIIKL